MSKPASCMTKTPDAKKIIQEHVGLYNVLKELANALTALTFW